MTWLLMLCVLVSANGQSAHIRNADRLYKQKKFSEALPEFEKAAEENAKDPLASYNLGDGYFRVQKYEDAAKAFDKPLAEGNDVSLRQRAYYNKGVALSRQSKLEESIAAYKSAVLLNPADNDARMNLQKALLERKKQDPEKDKKDEQKDKKNKQQNPPPQSKLNKKQVDQLLKALDQREQQVQQKMMQNRARGVTKPDKDW
jgi:Ca-activated chloride channel family protein